MKQTARRGSQYFGWAKSRRKHAARGFLLSLSTEDGSKRHLFGSKRENKGLKGNIEPRIFAPWRAFSPVKNTEIHAVQSGNPCAMWWAKLCGIRECPQERGARREQPIATQYKILVTVTHSPHDMGSELSVRLPCSHLPNFFIVRVRGQSSSSYRCDWDGRTSGPLP